MGEYNPYDDTDLSDVEIVEMAMGNPVGEEGLHMKQSAVRLTKAQASVISAALSQYQGAETDTEREITQRTERFLREKFDLDYCEWIGSLLKGFRLNEIDNFASRGNEPSFRIVKHQMVREKADLDFSSLNTRSTAFRSSVVMYSNQWK
jgi:hypothetical protein